MSSPELGISPKDLLDKKDLLESTAAWDSMREQDWDNLGTVVDLDTEIPWASISAGTGVPPSQQALPLSTDLSNDDYDLSWLGGTKLGQKNSTAENIDSLEQSSCWPCPPIQRCLKRPLSPDFVHNSEQFCFPISHDQSLSSDENSQDAGDDELPLIDDDSDSCRQTVRRGYNRMRSTIFESSSDEAPYRDDLKLMTDHRLYTSAIPARTESSLFTLHLFVTAIADGDIATDAPEKIGSVLEQVHCSKSYSQFSAYCIFLAGTEEGVKRAECRRSGSARTPHFCVCI